MKINITENDMTYYGIGYNYYNFINNVIPRISQWLVETYHQNQNIIDEETLIKNKKKLELIAAIIDED